MRFMTGQLSVAGKRQNLLQKNIARTRLMRKVCFAQGGFYKIQGRGAFFKSSRVHIIRDRGSLGKGENAEEEDALIVFFWLCG